MLHAGKWGRDLAQPTPYTELETDMVLPSNKVKGLGDLGWQRHIVGFTP